MTDTIPDTRIHDIDVAHRRALLSEAYTALNALGETPDALRLYQLSHGDSNTNRPARAVFDTATHRYRQRTVRARALLDSTTNDRTV